MGRLRDTYTKVESRLELGHFRAAELEFQKLPARALTTKRGLGLWMRLSRGFERWAEVEVAARQLRVRQPRETLPVLLEAEALHQQAQTQRAAFLLVTHAARFQGPTWPVYLATLRNYTTLNRQAVMVADSIGANADEVPRFVFSVGASGNPNN